MVIDDCLSYRKLGSFEFLEASNPTIVRQKYLLGEIFPVCFLFSLIKKALENN